MDVEAGSVPTSRRTQTLVGCGLGVGVGGTARKGGDVLWL